MTIPQRLARLFPLVAAYLVIAGGAAMADPVRWQEAGWRTDFSRAAVPLSEIISGGPPKDGIPSIDDPVFVPVSQTDRFADREPVIEILIEGIEPRAYPLSVLIWHEIVNDEVSGRPLAVTYCPLCNSAVVFDREIDGQVVEFGTTGMLRNSDLVMYDRPTESWWQQFTGEAIVGAHMGKDLRMVPSRVVAFADFRDRHPDGRVLVPEDWNARPYGRNPYTGYDGRQEPYPLYQGDLPEGIDPMARVVVVRHDGGTTAVTLTHLREQGEITVDGVKLKWSSGVSSALDHASIAHGRDVGAVSAEAAESGKPLVHDVTFAFVHHAFEPETPVLTGDGWLDLSRGR